MHSQPRVPGWHDSSPVPVSERFSSPFPAGGWQANTATTRVVIASGARSSCVRRRAETGFFVAMFATRVAAYGYFSGAVNERSVCSDAVGRAGVCLSPSRPIALTMGPVCLAPLRPDRAQATAGVVVADHDRLVVANRHLCHRHIVEGGVIDPPACMRRIRRATRPGTGTAIAGRRAGFR